MNGKKSLEERIKRVVQKEIVIVPYNSDWPRMFEEEKKHLFTCLPHKIIKRIEHFGSTAIPRLSAKPIIELLDACDNYIPEPKRELDKPFAMAIEDVF